MNVVMPEEPPMLSTPVAPLITPPVPLSAVVAEMVPLLVSLMEAPLTVRVAADNVPALVRFPVNVACWNADVPLRVPVTENVCAVFWVVNVVALFVKLLAKAKVAAAPVVVSFQTAPLLSATAPVNVIVRAVALVDPKFIVPEMDVAPLTVRFRRMVRIAPGLTVSAVHETVATVHVTGDPEAIMTVSAATGTCAGLQVPAVPHSPPLPVLVIIAA